MSTKKRRISVTMPDQYVKALDSLVEDGTYLNQGEVIRAGIRLVFKQHNLEIMSKPLRDQYE